MSTRGLEPRRRRTRAHNKRNEPPAKSATYTPECHQSSLSPCSHAAKTNAKPALAYKNPAKLGASPCSFAGGDFGMPKEMHNIINGVITAEFQNIHSQER